MLNGLPSSGSPYHFLERKAIQFNLHGNNEYRTIREESSLQSLLLNSLLFKLQLGSRWTMPYVPGSLNAGRYVATLTAKLQKNTIRQSGTYIFRDDFDLLHSAETVKKCDKKCDF